MKKNILYLTTIILGFTLGACSLDEDPIYAYPPETVFNTEVTTESAVNDMYGYFAQLYGSDLLKITIGNGTMVARVSTSEETRSAAYNTDVEGGTLFRSFQEIYNMIDSSNRILVGMEGSSLPEEYKKTVMGQAYFVRGYSYYLLGSLWGRAPMQLEPVEKGASLRRPLSSRTEVYKQAEKDWLMAAEDLPETRIIGKANKNVANAYLAKLYFMLASQKQAGIESSDYASANELWKKAIEYGEKVTGKEFLDPDYESMFKNVSQSNEILFQLNYTSSTAKGVQKNWNSLFGPYYYSYYTKTINAPDSYRTIVMDRAFYDFQAGTHPNDARMKTTYLTDYLKETKYKNEEERRTIAYPFVLNKDTQKVINGRDYMDDGSDPKNPQYKFLENDANIKDADKKAVKNLWTSTGYGQMGFFHYPYNGKGADKNAFSNYDSNNAILFRNADLLLILADAYNETGNGAKADEYINLVLNRAKLPAVKSMGQKERRDFIFFERMFELAGEPVLFEDVRRRGTEYLKKVIDLHNDSWFINFRYKIESESNNGNGNGTPFVTILINDKNTDENFLKKNLLLPYPQEEIRQNENISQKDQNFGYE